MLEIRLLKNPEDTLSPQVTSPLVYAAYDGEKLLGHCRFVVKEGVVSLLSLTAAPDDFAVADGLARAAIASAERLGAREASFDGEGGVADFAASLGAACGSRINIDEIIGDCRTAEVTLTSSLRTRSSSLREERSRHNIYGEPCPKTAELAANH